MCTMQPPPRKVKPNVALKNTHADQVSKLQAKHQQECDLLEDIRTYFSRKAALEKEYAQGLQKITSQLLKRDFPAQPDLSSEDGREHKTVCTVWRSILEESDRLAKARLQAAEVYAERAAEPLKPAKAAKVQTYKKVMPQLSVIQAEVAQCVMDLVKAHKAYTTDESVAHEARQKSSEAEDKLKRKSTGIFQSLASLQKSCAKLRSRTETSEVKETSARNEYLLALAAGNAHHIRYYSTDLPEIMKVLDCDIYEKIQESLTVAGQTAADIAKAESSSFHNIATEAAKICREFSLQCYLFQNPVFTNLVQYQFEPSHGDMCNKVSMNHGAGPELEKEARKWSTKVAKETRAIRDYYRQMTLLQNAKSGEKASESGSQESATTDPEAKLEEVKTNLRKAETSKLKAEARLEALREGGVNVDEWINQAQMESLAAEESGLARTPSQVSLRTESSGGHSATDDQEPTYTHYDDDDDFIDDTFHSGFNRSGRVYPIYCKALYDFEASNYDEMTIKGDEDLELIADGDGEGWVKAKNSLGQEGYIPETYVDLGGLSDIPAPLGVEAMNAINESVSESGTPTPQPPEPPASNQPATATVPDLQSPNSVDFQQDTTSSYSSGDLEVQQTTEVMVTDEPPVAINIVPNSEATWVRALYDYDAQADEELSFPEGALIRIIRKDDNGVDDGFWEGECNGQSGVFPSLVVEEIGNPHTAGDPLSPGMTVGARDFSIPPPVHITLPTPDAEPPPPPPTANGEEIDEPLPPPPPPLKVLFDSAEDSQSTPTPTADQSPKKVRFSNEQPKTQQYNLPNKNHPHSSSRQQEVEKNKFQDDTQPECHHYKQSGFKKLNNKKGKDSKTSKHKNPHQIRNKLREDQPSPILRHKSLPSSLDKQEPALSVYTSVDNQQQKDHQHSRPPLSPPPTRRTLNQQGISHSQPQLSQPGLRTPPSVRKLIVQQQIHQQQQQLQQLQHQQLQQQHQLQQLQKQQQRQDQMQQIVPETMSRPNQAPQSLALNLSNTQSKTSQKLANRSPSYPSSPLTSPQKECQTLTQLQQQFPPLTQQQQHQHEPYSAQSPLGSPQNPNQSLQQQQLLQLYVLSPQGNQQRQQQPGEFHHQKGATSSTQQQHPEKSAPQLESPSAATSQRQLPDQLQQWVKQKKQQQKNSPTELSQSQASHVSQQAYPRPDCIPQMHWNQQQEKIRQKQQQQQQQILQQQQLSISRSSGLSVSNKGQGSANDKVPLCFVDTDSEWESEEGEESLV